MRVQGNYAFGDIEKSAQKMGFKLTSSVQSLDEYSPLYATLISNQRKVSSLVKSVPKRGVYHVG